MSACEDLAAAPADIVPSPPTDGCADCLAAGSRDWVHLRLCLDCGHIGCCDNSPQRHASAHFHNTSHPVIRSYEPGEEWRWCYVHEAMG
ncbi:UBP-type zinc finger domain-containing protein [Kitasatospora sp. NBC_00240]|uniref:UBP-type zinc finger domain-containing protein n=1 Tax=Kitasatospora sp. NBC_00240 TaxID=2903567 RepID=UPI002259DCCD|nr:UBP-type zinc finger domain-containing protein [Kitasatospora sp. NBC_00240]MCX5212085.1 UBP-type zinc finger domain-containing protein [Kitasatospora sp. NBC_00240]